MLKEFREFAIQGNMVDLAVGLVLGVAFVTFVIVAFAVFILVRQANRLRRGVAVTMTKRDCPHCLSSIPLKATRCAFCTSEVQPAE